MSVLDRVAGAPISWGVCEAPGWGIELPAPRVLAEMRELGLTRTELGPSGYLGESPAQVRQNLTGQDVRLVGGFLPVALHLDAEADLTDAAAAMQILAEAGSEIVVLAVESSDGSYEHKVTLTEQDWPVLQHNLDRVRTLAADLGLAAALHPHVGTAVESRQAVLQVIERSDVPLCLDTGHLLIGGMQPAELLELAGDRVCHVHLKDVRAELAADVAGDRISYLEAVRAGLYVPLGDGDVDIAGVVNTLENIGYHGWYTLEQACSLDAVPAPGTGPIEDVRRSLTHLAAVTG